MFFFLVFFTTDLSFFLSLTIMFPYCAVPMDIQMKIHDKPLILLIVQIDIDIE